MLTADKKRDRTIRTGFKSGELREVDKWRIWDGALVLSSLWLVVRQHISLQRKPQATQKEYLLQLSTEANTVSAVPGNLCATPGPFIDCGISWLCFHRGFKSLNPPDPQNAESSLTLSDWRRTAYLTVAVIETNYIALYTLNKCSTHL